MIRVRLRTKELEPGIKSGGRRPYIHWSTVALSQLGKESSLIIWGLPLQRLNGVLDGKGNVEPDQNMDKFHHLLEL